MEFPQAQNELTHEKLSLYLVHQLNQSDFLSKEIIMLINLLLLGYVLKSSLINIARFSQCCFIIVIFMIVMLFIVGISDIDYKNLLPLKVIGDKKNTINFTKIYEIFFF